MTIDIDGGRRVVVVGAGIAGLLAASRVAEVAEVVVLEKGRGVGGRMSTRRIAGAVLDHGAQFLTATDAEFLGIVDSWEAAGVVARWFERPGGEAPRTAYRGVPSMTGPAKHLAAGLDVRTGALVEAVARRADGVWEVRVGGAPLAADAVLITAPVPQALALLDAGGVDLGAVRDGVSRLSYDPCIAVMAVFEDGMGGAEDAFATPVEGEGDLALSVCNAGKGISPVPALTLHGSPRFSTDRWDETDEAVTAALLAAAGVTARPSAVQVHRWRYARPTATYPTAVATAPEAPGLFLAGDAFGGPRVEGAARSGLAAAAAIRAHLGS